MKKLISSFLAICMLATFINIPVLAGPANPHPFEVVQPDGETITVSINGDEFFNYETAGNAIIMKDYDGYYKYISIEGNSLVLKENVSSGKADLSMMTRSKFASSEIYREKYIDLYKAVLMRLRDGEKPISKQDKSTSSEPTSSEPTSSEPTSSEPTSSEPTSSEPTSSEPTSSEPTSSEPTSSEEVIPPQETDFDSEFYFDNSFMSAAPSITYNELGLKPGVLKENPMLVVLVEFSDQSAVYTEADWNSRIFGSGKSVRDFYIKNTNSQLTIKPANETSGTANDGVVKVKLNYNHPNPAKTNELNRKAVKDALAIANSFVDYKSFDANNDGDITADELNILTVVAGFEQSYGGSSAKQPRIWAHKWHLNDLALDNVTFNFYAQIGEVHGMEYSDNDHQATIGIIVHELGHDFGLPDLYDTLQGGGGAPFEIGTMSVMASGSWGTAQDDQFMGATPTSFDAWSKIDRGFYTPTVVDYNQTVQMVPNSTSGTFNILKVLTKNPNEYFLVENRSATGYDAGMDYDQGVPGITIWHIDDKLVKERRNGSGSTIKFNSVNAYDPMGVTPEWGNNIFCFVSGGTLTDTQLNNGTETGIKFTIGNKIGENTPVTISGLRPEITNLTIKCPDNKTDFKQNTKIQLTPVPTILGGVVYTPKYVWKSSDTAVMTVDTKGLVTAKKAGTASITVTADNSISATVDMTALTIATGVSIVDRATNKAITSKTISYVSETETETLQLDAVVLPTVAHDKTVTWISSNKAVATVSDDGLVTAVAKGTTTITAISNDQAKKATCNITVAQGVAEIKLTPETATVAKGKTLAITTQILPVTATNKTVVWTTRDDTVATVDKTGKVTVLKTAIEGETATITATQGTKFGSVVVTAGKTPASAVNTIVGEKTVVNNGTMTLSASVSPADASQGIVWTSSNKTIADIDTTTGVITPVLGKVGSVTFTATTTDGTNLKKTHPVSITQPITSKLELSIDETSGVKVVEGGVNTDFIKDKTIIIKSVAADSGDGNVIPVLTWKISDTKLATVLDNKNGTATVKILKPGKVTIIAEVKDTSKTTAIINVNAINFAPVVPVAVEMNTKFATTQGVNFISESFGVTPVSGTTVAYGQPSLMVGNKPIDGVTIETLSGNNIRLLYTKPENEALLKKGSYTVTVPVTISGTDDLVGINTVNTSIAIPIKLVDTISKVAVTTQIATINPLLMDTAEFTLVNQTTKATMYGFDASLDEKAEAFCTMNIANDSVSLKLKDNIPLEEGNTYQADVLVWNTSDGWTQDNATKVTMKIKITTKGLSPTIANPVVTVNKQVIKTVAKTKLALGQSYAALAGEQTATVSSGNENATKGLLVTCNAKGDITATITDAATLTAGTYTYAIKPSVYVGGVTIALAPVSFNVTVIDPPTAVSISSDNIVLNKGEDTSLIATVTPNIPLNQAVVWSTSSAKIATVDKNGKVTALGRGVAKITAKTPNNKSAIVQVTVNAPLTSIGFTVPELYINRGGSATTKLIAYPLDTLDKPTYTYSIKNADGTAVDKKFVAVDNKGKIDVSKTIGENDLAKDLYLWAETTIRGEVFSTYCIVHVVEPIKSIGFEMRAKTLSIGETDKDGVPVIETYQLKPCISPEPVNGNNVTYASNNPAVAKVDSLGLVTPLSKGAATVTAYANDGSKKNAAVNIVVNQHVTGIVLDMPEVGISKGKTIKLTPTVYPADATNKKIIWVSNNPAVATVSGGTVKVASNAEVDSEVLIKAVSESSQIAATCKVTVTSTIDSLGFRIGATNNVTKHVKNIVGDYTNTPQTEQLTARAKIGGIDKDIIEDKLIWKSSNLAVATVDDKGKVTYKGKGNTKITATTTDGSAKTATLDLTVNIKSATVEVNKTQTIIAKGGTEQLTATVFPLGANIDNAVVWSSDNANVKCDKGRVVIPKNFADPEVKITATIKLVGPSGAITFEKSICTVTVTEKPAVSKVVISPKESYDVVGLGKVNAIDNIVTVTPATAEQGVFWRSSNNNVVEIIVDINNPSKVSYKAVGYGTAIISAISEEGNKTATKTINVYPIAKAETLVMAGANVTGPLVLEMFGANKSALLEIKDKNKNKVTTYSSDMFTFSTSNEKYVIVASDGTVMATGVGTAIITATLNGDPAKRKVTFPVTVTNTIKEFKGFTQTKTMDKATGAVTNGSGFVTVVNGEATVVVKNYKMFEAALTAMPIFADGTLMKGKIVWTTDADPRVATVTPNTDGTISVKLNDASSFSDAQKFVVTATVVDKKNNPYERKLEYIFKAT